MVLAAVSLVVAAASSALLLPQADGDVPAHFDFGGLGLLLGLFVATSVVFPFFGVYAQAALYDRRLAARQVVKAVTGVVMALLLGAAALRSPLATPA